MSDRSLRRAAERQAKKATGQTAAVPSGQTFNSAAAPAPVPNEPELVPASPAPRIELPDDAQSEPAPSHPTTSQAQIDANRSNAKRSTGPKTDAGKAISSQNRSYHGLAGLFRLMPWEDVKAFVDLQDDLREHYRPADLVEQSYVDRLAEHMWARQRCIALQAYGFDEKSNSRCIENEKQFALLARYQLQNEHGMDKCVNMLLKFQAARRKEQNGFESEIRQNAAETRKIEAHEARLRLINARAKRIETECEIQQPIEALVPRQMRIPFEELSGAFRGPIRQMSQEIQEKVAAA